MNNPIAEIITPTAAHKPLRLYDKEKPIPVKKVTIPTTYKNLRYLIVIVFISVVFKFIA